MALYSGAKAYATGTCSGCGREYAALVATAEGENFAYVRCSECGHINAAEDFEGVRSA